MSGIGPRDAHFYFVEYLPRSDGPRWSKEHTSVILSVENIPISILSVLFKNACFVLEAIIF